MTYLSHISQLQTLYLMRVKLRMAIIDMSRNINWVELRRRGCNRKPEVVVDSRFLTHLHKETILCSHPLRSKESATTWSI